MGLEGSQTERIQKPEERIQKPEFRIQEGGIQHWAGGRAFTHSYS
jgi:hypothetical protein